MATSRTDTLRAEINSLLSVASLDTLHGASILTIDPDASTPGAAYWTPAGGTLGGRLFPRAWSWGGNTTGAALADPHAVVSLLATLRPGLVIVEAPLASGGPWAAQMHSQNIVRGGWLWLAALAGIETVLLPPDAWQRPICPDKGPRKAQYKRWSRGVLGRPVNEDAAAALGMLAFALSAIGHELPEQIETEAPLTPAGEAG